jgi:hypothetical protein
MFFDPDTVPSGENLEVIVPLDTTLVPTPLQRGDLVLLFDRGAPPADGDPGRPRQVFQWLELRYFDGSSMRLFVPPQEWVQWREVHTALGSAPQILPVPPDGDPEAMARSLNEVWGAEWEAEAHLVEATLPEPEPVREAGPGELEVIVPLDKRLVPSGVRVDDLVLLVDPGAEPTAVDPGRPRRVIRTLKLQDFQGASVRLFVPPREWIEWRLLATEIGADPLVLPVTDGTDAEKMAAELDAEWESRWRRATAALPTAPAGWFQVSLPLDAAGAAMPLRDGDLEKAVDAAFLRWARQETRRASPDCSRVCFGGGRVVWLLVWGLVVCCFGLLVGVGACWVGPPGGFRWRLLVFGYFRGVRGVVRLSSARRWG